MINFFDQSESFNSSVEIDDLVHLVRERPERRESIFFVIVCMLLIVLMIAGSMIWFYMLQQSRQIDDDEKVSVGQYFRIFLIY